MNMTIKITSPEEYEIDLDLNKIRKSHILDHFKERMKINGENGVSGEITNVYTVLMELDNTFREEDRNRIEAFIKNVYYWIYTTDNFDSGFLDDPQSVVKKYYIASMYKSGVSIEDIPGYCV